MGQRNPPEIKPQPLCKNSGETVPFQTVPMCMHVLSFSHSHFSLLLPLLIIHNGGSTGEGGGGPVPPTTQAGGQLLIIIIIYIIFFKVSAAPTSKTSFKLRRNAPLSNLVSKSFSAVPTSENIEPIALV